MTPTTLIWFLVIGLCAGWLAAVLVKGGGYGLFGDIVVGVIGAILGGWIFGLLGITTTGLFGLLFTAVVGAVVLISLFRVIRHS
jgi:uncharacterized membrane protein YeaQ/YmgE (transglycosylase-associated protein family)